MIKIEFKKGEMIVTHPTGVVNEYDKANILKQRHTVELAVYAANDELKHLDGIMSKIDKSVTNPPLLTRLRKFVTRKV